MICSATFTRSWTPFLGGLPNCIAPPYREEKHINEETRETRQLDALESIAAELVRLRLLKEHELGVRIEHGEGDPFMRAVEEG